MKILNLQFKNINSLEGDNRIDFDQPPFSDSGVFAITGPNGSGKSSILDAITLALYGETFRFDKPAPHVMTKHTSECSSQIEFSLGGEIYRSSWQVKRQNDSPKGMLLPTEMRLIKLENQETVADTPQQVCEKIQDITGMNFRSFTRSIILAQGDFAAFLNAVATERMAILEKIISTDIYARHKDEVLERQKSERQKLTYLQQDIAAIPLIEPKSLEGCELDLADFKEQTGEHQQEVNALKKLQADLTESVRVQKQLAEKEARLQKSQSEKAAVQSQLDKLISGENALDFQEDIENIEKQSILLAKENDELGALENERRQIQATLALPSVAAINPDQINALADNPNAFVEQKQAADNIRNQAGLFSANWQSELSLQQLLSNQLSAKEEEMTGVVNWLDEHAKDAVLLEEFPDIYGLKTVRIKLGDLRENKKALDKWSKYTQTALQKNQAGVEKKNEKIEELKEELRKEEALLLEIAQGNTLKELEELHDDQKNRVKKFEELVNLAIANEKLAPKPSFLMGLFGKQSLPIRDENELEKELETLREQIKRDENIRLSLEKAIYNDALLARMAPERHVLVDGKPCPLCGATEHPYSKRPPAPVNTQQALTDQRIRIKRINAEINDLEAQLKAAQKRAERNQANSNQLQQINSRWLTLCNELNVSGQDMTIGNVSLVRNMLKTEETDLNNIALLLNKYKSCEKRIATLNETIEKTIATVEQLSAQIQTIDNEWQTAPGKFSEHETEEAAAILHEQTLSTRLTEQLALLDEDLPGEGKEDALIQRLSIRRDEYAKYMDIKTGLSQEVDVLKVKLSECRQQIDNYKGRLDNLNNQLHNTELIGLHLALVEKQKFIAEKENRIKDIKDNLAQMEQAFTEKLAGSQFTSKEDIKLVLQQLGGKAEVERQRDGLVEQIAVLEQEITAFQERLSALNLPETNTDLEPESIQLQIKALNEKMSIAQMECERLERVIQEQKSYREKHAQLQEQIVVQQTLVSEVDAEAAELSQENGMTFRRRVQDNMVEKLLSKTNAILEKISGRYYVRRQPSDQGLVLNIEDTFQNNVRRLPKTLSGGESFIVSLALALGLAEMAENGKSVESLFLDEGFGNLDAESLYTVINTLESLRAVGKTVGVISHVEAVQRRFKAQLQLVKKPNGLGELRRVS